MGWLWRLNRGVAALRFSFIQNVAAVIIFSRLSAQSHCNVQFHGISSLKMARKTFKT
jgi:hypothetical protein